MLKKYLCLLILFLPLKSAFAEDTVRIKIVGMADLHGNFIDYDHIRKRPAVGGLPFVNQFVRQQRMDTTQHVLLLSGGDVLQGSMQTYYYNYVDRREEYMPAVLFNRAGVDASVVGNHDLEVGGVTLERFRRQLNSPLLGANIVHEGTGIPYFKPYAILERGGIRIAILGLSMPIQSECVTVQIMQGLEVANMYEPTKLWMNHIRTHESPDLIIGLFHAGFPYGSDSLLIGEKCFLENNTLYIAQNVPGFDAIVLGHLHQNIIARIVNVEGDSVWMIEPGYGGRDVGVLNFELLKRPGQKAKILRSSARVQNVYIPREQLSPESLSVISREAMLMDMISDEPVATLLDTICNVNAFFGPSYFVDLVHKVQLERTGADVSFASPLSTNVVIYPGDITFSDLFRLYRFENTLVVLSMTGQEILDYLEYAYNLWVNQMFSPEDRMLKTKENSAAGKFLARQFEIPQYYFDSGAGLDYEIDVTKPFGERIRILRMWNGEPFEKDRTYSVVTNRYRFSGAGGHMEIGAGISSKELPYRIISYDNIMIRELIRKEFVRQGEVRSFHYNHWKFVPKHYLEAAKSREFSELQGR
jgi:2',3'-cyclic-nucleotide 2'-phosphodiesterase/3'-nucleotidase